MTTFHSCVELGFLSHHGHVLHTGLMLLCCFAVLFIGKQKSLRFLNQAASGLSLQLHCNGQWDITGHSKALAVVVAMLWLWCFAVVVLLYVATIARILQLARNQIPLSEVSKVSGKSNVKDIPNPLLKPYALSTTFW